MSWILLLFLFCNCGCQNNGCGCNSGRSGRYANSYDNRNMYGRENKEKSSRFEERNTSCECERSKETKCDIPGMVPPTWQPSYDFSEKESCDCK